jgi:ribose-phosphate pyrophosphokinase
MSITLSGNGYRRTITHQGMYSDDTPIVKDDEFLRIVRDADTMTIRHTSMAEFVTAMFLVDAIKANGGHIYNLVLPYIPGARQDRSNPTGDVLFTLASVARMLNERMFQRVVVLDPHSDKALDLIHRAVVYPQEFVAHKFRGIAYDGIISADKGGEVRARQFSGTLGLPIYYGGKVRDVTTGHLSGFTLDKIPQGHYLVVDDICDGGGTFVGLGALIKEQGSTADLFVSHGIFSKGTKALRECYENIYTTDSLLPNDIWDGVTVLPVVEDMEKYGNE